MQVRLATMLAAVGGCLVVGALGAAGCSSSSSSGSTTGGGQDSGTASEGGSDSGAATAACAAEAHAVCTLRSTCSSFNLSENYTSEASCESRTAAECVANLGATGTGQTPAGIQACAAAYPSETCANYYEGNPVTACVPPAGTGATGAACGASAQCASTFCAIPEYQVCGTCQPLPVAGATCQVQADCGRDLACAVPAGATSGKCAAWGASGAACLTGVSPCGAGLACVGDDTTTMAMGTCQASGQMVGQACDGSRKTAANCDGTLGLICIPTAKGSEVGTCQTIQLVTAGTACGDIGAAPITGYADCTGGGLCARALNDAGTAVAMGTCVAPAADGAACDSDPTKGPPCLAPAKCVPTSSGGTAGTCTLPDATKCM
jgi:hypothetical protein